MDLLTGLLHRLRVSSWWDVADIAVVSFLIYQALKLIQPYLKGELLNELIDQMP